MISQEECFTQIEKLNAKLLEAEKSKTRFLSLIRNEFDNPLVGMVSLLGQLHTSMKQNADENYETLDLVYMDVLKLNLQLSNIMSVAAVETGVLEKNTTVFNIVSMLSDIDNALHHLFEKKKLHVEKTITSPEELYNDRDKVYTILINLIANAYEYCTPDTQVIISISEENGFLIVSVRNDGVEIQDSQAVFDAFYQQTQGFNRAHQGLGVGLSVVGAFVDFLGGEISITRDNESNIFTAKIPAYAHDGEVSMGDELDAFMFD